MKKDAFTELLISRSEWHASLRSFVGNPNTVDRFQHEFKADQLNLSDFFYNEPKFFKLFSLGVQRKEFSLVPAKETILPVKNKKRKIHSFPVFETFVYEHAARVLRKLVDGFISTTSVYGYRKGASDALATAQVQADIKNAENPLWIIRRDVKDFGLSLPHQLIMAMLSERLNLSETSKDFLWTLLRFPYSTESDATIRHNICGCPTGTTFQHVVANFYMHDLDKAFKGIVQRYVRCGDDVLIICDSEARAAQAMELVDGTLAKKLLPVNKKKCRQLILSKSQTSGDNRFPASQSFDYLGRTIRLDGKTLRPRDKFQAIQHAIDHYLGRTGHVLRAETLEMRVDGLCKAMRYLLCDGGFALSAAILESLRKIESEKHLKEFDCWIAITVLKHALRKPHKKTLLRRVSLRQLRELGLPSVRYIKHRYAFSK